MTGISSRKASARYFGLERGDCFVDAQLTAKPKNRVPAQEEAPSPQQIAYRLRLRTNIRSRRRLNGLSGAP
jgi:hypothetical protein